MPLLSRSFCVEDYISSDTVVHHLVGATSAKYILRDQVRNDMFVPLKGLSNMQGLIDWKPHSVFATSYPRNLYKNPCPLERSFL